MSAKRVIACAVLAAAFSTAAYEAAAQATYPSRAVRIIIPFPPGGGTDLVARTLAQKLTETWGQPVIVDNRAGANGIIGTDLGAKSKPDGHTFLVVIATHAINPSLYRNEFEKFLAAEIRKWTQVIKDANVTPQTP